jgi:hypothetical protein
MGVMTMRNEQQKRTPWTTPKLQRIDAGSAEATTNNQAHFDDSGPPSQDKS